MAEESNDGLFAWLQDNARVIISIVLVLFLLYAVYNYSKNRTVEVSDDSSDKNTELAVKSGEITSADNKQDDSEQKQDNSNENENKDEDIKQADDTSEQTNEQNKETENSADSNESSDDAKEKTENSVNVDGKGPVEQDNPENKEAEKKDDSEKVENTDTNAEDDKKVSKITLDDSSNDNIGIKSDENKDAEADNGEKKEDSSKNENQSNSPLVSYGEQFVEVKATKGDGLTHLARRATSEYISHNNISDLTPGQRVYIEDYMRRRVKNVRVLPGVSVKFDLKNFEDAVTKAKSLSDEQKKHLEKFAKNISF